ncbi:MAG: hypothetical protein IRZ16_22030 [Myxococcaceae bacterium]|nr:hypothetical protein [Myxococcaceae bacterium]
MVSTDEAVDAAIRDAAEELGLPAYYRSLVRSLVRNPNGRWPRCCGGGCSPCADTLCQVALRACELLGTPRTEPLP